MDKLDEIRKFGVIEGYPIIKDESTERFIEILKSVNPNRILEIGTAIGYSGSLMLLNSNASLDTIEMNQESARIARNNFEKLGLGDRVKVLVGDANEVIDTLIGEKYDFIFLDGPKGQYIKYLNRLIELLNIQGVLLADNVLFRGYIEGDNVPKKYRTLVNNLRKFNDAIMSDDRLISDILHIGDGLSVSKKIKE